MNDLSHVSNRCEWASIDVALNVGAPEECRWTSTIRSYVQQDQAIMLHSKNAVGAMIKALSVIIRIDCARMKDEGLVCNRWRHELQGLLAELTSSAFPGSYEPGSIEAIEKGPQGP